MCKAMVLVMVEYKGKMTRINITVPEDLLEDFKKYCEKQFRPLSAQLQFMMKETLEQELTNQLNSSIIEKNNDEKKS